MGLDDRTTPLQYMIPCPSDGAEIKKGKPYQVKTKDGGTRYMTGEELKKMGLKYED